ncbi:Siderophore iron transporter [Neofusicoccum parvum]|uniref:Siderophore iron transporter n=1 Tax=Neofusicoccum parvum TaxID=310453 RepID=A0ACB5SKB2_9PEZI|nr:Siderophore iron transporter [Neofusicoccum parvum]GME45627.1 Siderophore iron transporter [Neofusicoccum parvum]
MGFFPKKTVAEQPAEEPAPAAPSDIEKTAEPHHEPVKDSVEDLITKDAQAGVQKVEAVTAVWSKWHLILAYLFIWLFYVVTSIQEVALGVFTPFVTSAFSLHSLTAATSIMASIIAGLFKLPLSKVLDTWGRPQGLGLMLVIWIVGFIMMAACNGVTTYAAAQVFYSTGSQGVSYVLTIFVADTSTLKSRALMLSFATTPYIFTTWAAGPITDSVLGTNGMGWRWGIGMWAIVAPFVIGPLVFLFLWNQHKAEKMGLLEPQGKISHITAKSVWKFCIDVDLLGIFILGAGMALFLLPFSLYSYQADGWRSPMIIAMIVVGAVLVGVFVLWERYWAPVTFIPFKLLADRTVFFGGMMFVFVFCQSSIWGSYFTSMLMVVWETSASQTTYISNIYRTGSCFFSIIISALIYRTGRFKPFALFFLVPLMMLGVGLMIHFRQPDQSLGYIIMTQIFVAFAGGPIVICGEMAMLSPSDHQHVAVIMAVLDLFGSIGSAIGGTIAAAIWTGTFYKNLVKYTPEGTDVASIYGDITVQLSYESGSPTSNGIKRAYGDSQRIMCITSVCFLVGALTCVALWRNLNVKHIKQVRGNVV